MFAQFENVFARKRMFIVKLKLILKQTKNYNMFLPISFCNVPIPFESCRQMIFLFITHKYTMIAFIKFIILERLSTQQWIPNRDVEPFKRNIAKKSKIKKNLKKTHMQKSEEFQKPWFKGQLPPIRSRRHLCQDWRLSQTPLRRDLLFLIQK